MTATSRPVRTPRAAAASLLTLAALALGAGMALPAQATVTMIMSAERDFGPDPRADGGVVGDPASRVRGFAGTGGIVGGKAFAEAFPGQSMGPACLQCGTVVRGDTSETAASADAEIGRLRGWSYASGNENVGGTVLDGLSLRVGSQATFGWVDPITVTSIVSSNLELVLNMHASWHVNAPANAIDPSYKRFAVATLGVSMALQQWLCFGSDGCAWDNIGVLSFLGFASEFDGIHSEGYLWSIGAGDEAGTGSSVNDTRSLRVEVSPVGQYRMVVEGTIGTGASGRAGAQVDFANTGYIGLVGSYLSGSGYRYPGAAITDSGNGVPTPATLPLMLAGITLAAVATVRRRQPVR